MPVKKNKWRGQTGVETLMAVILITGLLLVVSVISLQQNLESNRLTELKENSAICDHLTTLIDSIGRFSGQSEVLIVLPKQIWVQKGPENANDLILFNPENTGYFCRLQTRLSFGEETMLDIDSGVVYISKNADNEVVISNSPPLNSSLYHGPGDPTCVPNTCANAVPGDPPTPAVCGSPSNGCGGYLSCGSCEPPQTCNSIFQCETSTPQNCNNNGTCDSGPPLNETTISCPADCVCGNLTIDPPSEQCDKTNLGGATCQSLGFGSGTLACYADTCLFDTSNCSSVIELSNCGAPIGGWINEKTYRVAKPLNAGSTTCFTITGANITLECNGYLNSITGTGAALISVAGTGINVENCQLNASNANSTGVAVQTAASGTVLSGLQINNPQIGISLASSATVMENQINAYQKGIYSTAGSQTITSNTITIGGLSESANHYGIWLTHSGTQFSSVQGNTITSTNYNPDYQAIGIEVDNGTGNTISGNTLTTTSTKASNGILANNIQSSTISQNSVCGGNTQTINISSANIQASNTDNTCAANGCTHTAGKNSKVCIIASGTVGNCGSTCGGK